MADTNVLIIGAVVISLVAIILLVPWGGKCNCSEAYSNARNAQFTVNKPKYVVPQSNPIKSEIGREGFILPTPTKAMTIQSDNLNGGFTTHTSMPMMGALHGEATYGVSVPGMNTATTVSGNGAQNPASRAVWKTVI